MRSLTSGVLIGAFVLATPGHAQEHDAGTVTVPVIPARVFLIAGDDAREDGLTVTGTLVDKDINPAHSGDWPADALNTVRILCQPSIKMCIEADATIQSNHLLFSDLTLWEIDSATKTKLVATAEALCASSTLTINLATKEVTIVRMNGGLGDYAACIKKQNVNGHEVALYVPPDHPIVWTLVSGSEAMKIDPRFKK
jgi:hypothetical protein